MFWVVIPAYNTEDYIRETIDSVIGQTIGFEEHIMLYLIDDGSTDGTFNCLREYKKKYPDNVVIKHFENNHGVSAARNTAISEIRQKKDATVLFLDSDDLLKKDAIWQAAQFFEKEPEVNIASLKILYFDAKEGEHRLNWKFEKCQVVDIKENYNYPQFYIGGVFLRRSALQAIEFDERMNFWEDALAINRCILGEGRYGLIRDGIYYYRKRPDESSLVDRAWTDKERYTTFLDRGYRALMSYSRRKYHRVIPYVQFLVAYHLRLFLWKSKGELISELLTEDEMKKFRKNLKKVLRPIKPKIISEIPTSVPVLEMIMSIKQGKKVRARRTYTENDCIFSFRGTELARMSERKVRIYDTLSEREGFEGMWHGIFATPVFQMAEADYIFMEHEGTRMIPERYPCRRKLFILGEKVRNYRFAAFAFWKPDDWDEFQFGIHTNGIDIMLNYVVFEDGKWNWEGEKEKNSEF